MGREIARHTVTRAKEEATGTVVKIDFDSTDYNLKPWSKSVFKALSDTRTDIDCTSNYLRVVVKSNVETIVENCLTRWTNKLQWQVGNAVKSTSEYILQC